MIADENHNKLDASMHIKQRTSEEMKQLDREEKNLDSLFNFDAKVQNQLKNSLIISLLFWSGFLSLVHLHTWIYEGSPFHASLFHIPWMKALIWDLGMTHLIVFSWMYYKLSSSQSRFLWCASVLASGSIALSLFLSIQLLKLKEGDPLFFVLLHPDHNKLFSRSTTVSSKVEDAQIIHESSRAE